MISSRRNSLVFQYLFITAFFAFIIGGLQCKDEQQDSPAYLRFLNACPNCNKVSLSLTIPNPEATGTDVAPSTRKTIDEDYFYQAYAETPKWFAPFPAGDYGPVKANLYSESDGNSIEFPDFAMKENQNYTLVLHGTESFFTDIPVNLSVLFYDTHSDAQDGTVRIQIVSYLSDLLIPLEAYLTVGKKPLDPILNIAYGDATGYSNEIPAGVIDAGNIIIRVLENGEYRTIFTNPQAIKLVGGTNYSFVLLGLSDPIKSSALGVPTQLMILSDN